MEWLSFWLTMWLPKATLSTNSNTCHFCHVVLMNCHSWHSTHKSHWQHWGDQGLWWPQLFCLSLLLLILNHCTGFVALVLSQHGFYEWHPGLTCKAMPRTQGLGLWRTLTNSQHSHLSPESLLPSTRFPTCWGLFLPFKTLTFSASLILAFCPSGHLQYTPYSVSLGHGTILSWSCLHGSRSGHICLGTMSWTRKNSRFVACSHLLNAASEYLVWTRSRLCLLAPPYGLVWARMASALFSTLSVF